MISDRIGSDLLSFFRALALYNLSNPPPPELRNSSINQSLLIEPILRVKKFLLLRLLRLQMATSTSLTYSNSNNNSIYFQNSIISQSVRGVYISIYKPIIIMNLPSFDCELWSFAPFLFFCDLVISKKTTIYSSQQPQKRVWFYLGQTTKIHFNIIISYISPRDLSCK